MRRLVVASLLLCSFGCGSDGPQLPAAGEACDAEGQCAGELSCVHLICADDTGPRVHLSSPRHLDAYDGEITNLSVDASGASLDDGDQIELVLDPAASDPVREVVSVSTNAVHAALQLASPLAVGPHHLRARVLDGDGQPYPNPSATSEIVFFVRDPVLPNTPQVAIVWPPSGYQHRFGDPLEVEVAVLPGSFTFAINGSDCPPIDDCEPELAPECESGCGPVSRVGHVKVYTHPGYPGCLLDSPIGCNGDYIAALRPGNGAGIDIIDGHQVRAALSANLFDEPGSVLLSAALSYTYHDPWPSEENVIYETINLQLVE